MLVAYQVSLAPAGQLAELLYQGPVLLGAELKAVAPDIHHVEILRLVQLYKALAILQQVVGVVAGGFPCHKIVGHRKVVGVTHHAGVADAQRGQQGGDLRCPAAVGVGKAAHG